MKKTILTTLSALTISVLVYGQEMIFTSPVQMGKNINTPYQESNPLLSADGTTLYFVRSGAPGNSGGELAGQDIWYSKWINGSWTEASNDLKTINNGDNNAVVGISDNGNKLFLINTYSSHPRRDRGIVFTTKTGETWLSPRELDLVLKIKSDLYGFHVTPDEDVLLISMESEGTLGQEDLYVSFKNANNSWSKPLHLGERINSKGFEISPFLSADKKTLYFASNGLGGYGSSDIFKSERLDDTWTNWSEPVNLGAEINSSGFDAYFSVYNDKAFFSSNRSGGNTDIYAMGAGIKEEEQIPAAIPSPQAEVKETADEIKADETEIAEPATEGLEIETTYTVYFSFDQFQLADDGLRILKDATMDFKKAEKITIAGHADSQGPEEYNQLLSEKRAKTVATYLETIGISSEKIHTVAAGEDHPVASNEVIELRKKNRRVEIKVVYKK